MRRITQINWLPVAMSVFFWLALLGLLIFVDPEILLPIKLAPLWILLWLAIFYPVTTISKKAIDGVIIASAITGFAALRYLGLGNIVNGVLLLGLVIVIEWWRRAFG